MQLNKELMASSMLITLTGIKTLRTFSEEADTTARIGSPIILTYFLTANESLLFKNYLYISGSFWSFS